MVLFSYSVPSSREKQFALTFPSQKSISWMKDENSQNTESLARNFIGISYYLMFIFQLTIREASGMNFRGVRKSWLPTQILFCLMYLNNTPITKSYKRRKKHCTAIQPENYFCIYSHFVPMSWNIVHLELFGFHSEKFD